MTKGKWHRFIRRSHRYLGLLFGIQFFFWTIGGLYFSWTSIKQIRGEDIRKKEPALKLENSAASLATIIGSIKERDTVHHVISVQMASVLDTLYYQVTYSNGEKNKTQLANAQSGKLRSALSKSEAITVAKSRLQQHAVVKEVTYLTAADGHHEYREKPLPAYAITFAGNINATVYVAAEKGTVESFRNNSWRVFDFLWMLHTMDYQNRDNINNWLLRIFSALGLITILSGFALYLVSSRQLKKIFKVKQGGD